MVSTSANQNSEVDPVDAFWRIYLFGHWAIIGSNYGLSPVSCQVILNDVCYMSIRHKRTNYKEIWIENISPDTATC